MSKQHGPAAAAAVATALGLTAVAAHANPFVLAQSSTHKLQVVAEAGAAWCAPDVRLKIILQPGSPDAGRPDAQVTVMNLLRTPIERDCKAARTVEIEVSGPGAAPGLFQASAESNWKFAAVSPPAGEKPAPAATAENRPVDAPSQVPAPAPVAAAPAPQTTRSADHVLQPASQPPAVPGQPAAIPPFPPPGEVGWASLMLAHIRSNPALAGDGTVLRLWAAYKHPDLYRQNFNQEFGIHALMEQARGELKDELAGTGGKFVTVIMTTQIGQYDFSSGSFPVELHDGAANIPCNLPARDCYQNGFVLKFADLSLASSLPMSADNAQAFTARRTNRWSVVDRNLIAVITVRLDDDSFKDRTGAWLNASGTLERVVLYADDQARTPIYQVTPDDLQKLRALAAAKREAEQKAAEEQREAAAKAEQQREADMRRQQMLAQRRFDIQMLTAASDSIKLANWISAGQVNPGLRLDDLMHARAAALLNGGPVDVAMLVQAGAGGRDQIDTKWPGHLRVSVPAPAALSSSGWYLVAGTLTVPPGDDLPTAQLSAARVYACSKPKCTDAMDPTAIVDRKIAAAKQ
jgi:hypothetical protein